MLDEACFRRACEAPFPGSSGAASWRNQNRGSRTEHIHRDIHHNQILESAWQGPLRASVLGSGIARALQQQICVSGTRFRRFLATLRWDADEESEEDIDQEQKSFTNHYFSFQSKKSEAMTSSLLVYTNGCFVQG